MNKFLVKLCCFVGIQMAILVCVTSYGSRDAASNEYLYALKDKLDLLKTTPSPRIIFAGGSNLAFGLDSSMVKQETGLNPVNLGLHGRLGVLPLLRMVEENLKPGDVVVLSPEYTNLFQEPGCTKKIAIEAFEAWPECLDYIQPDIDKPLAELVPPKTSLTLLSDCVRRARKRLEYESKESQQPEIYQRDSFNRFGDHVAHHHNAPRAYEFRDLTEIDLESFAKFSSRINQFHNFCRKQNVAVYFTHSPLPATCLKGKKHWQRKAQEIITKNITVSVITDIEMLAFDDSMFYDSMSHLTKDGAGLRTSIVCEQLRKFELSTAAGETPQIK